MVADLTFVYVTIVHIQMKYASGAFASWYNLHLVSMLMKSFVSTSSMKFKPLLISASKNGWPRFLNHSMHPLGSMSSR